MEYVKIPKKHLVRRLTLNDESSTAESRRMKLRQLMWKTGLHSKDVAALLDYSTTSVRVWSSEKSKGDIPYHALKRLCVILNYDIETITPLKKRSQYANNAG